MSDSGARWPRRAGLTALAAITAWVACALWNAVKPLPPGMHVTSLPARIAETDLEFLDDRAHPGAVLRRERDLVGRAEQSIVLDQCPLGRGLADQLLLRKRQRPNLRIMLVTDPRNEVYGGTPAKVLTTLERNGIVVVRARLERTRDANPLYSSLWRLTLGWWSNAFDEAPGQITLQSSLRWRNSKSDRRQLLVADDGAGGWTSLVLSAGDPGSGNDSQLALEVRGQMAHDIVASELKIAAWSSDDDRLPALPPRQSRGIGSIDVRFVTEGAVRTSLGEAIAAAGDGDAVMMAARAFDDPRMLEAVAAAAARGARVQLMLDADLTGNRAAAGALMRRGAERLEIRWRGHNSQVDSGYAVIQHGGDVLFEAGSANYTRRSLGDLDLDAAIELHLPARAATARAALARFADDWSSGAAYAEHRDESDVTYWRYRLAEATGLAVD